MDPCGGEAGKLLKTPLHLAPGRGQKMIGEAVSQSGPEARGEMTGMGQIVSRQVLAEITRARFLPLHDAQDLIRLDLPQTADLFEPSLEEHASKGPLGEVGQVIRIDVHRRSRRHGTDEYATGSEKLRQVSDQAIGVGDVLDRLQGDDSVKQLMGVFENLSREHDRKFMSGKVSKPVLSQQVCNNVIHIQQTIESHPQRSHIFICQ